MRVSPLKGRDSMTRVSPGSTISVECTRYIHKEQMLDDVKRRYLTQRPRYPWAERPDQCDREVANDAHPKLGLRVRSFLANLSDATEVAAWLARRQDIADNCLGFFQDTAQMIRSAEALRINLVDILGP